MNDYSSAWWWSWLLPREEQSTNWIWAWERTAPWLPTVAVVLLALLTGMTLTLYGSERATIAFWRRGMLSSLRILAYGGLLVMLFQGTVLRQRTGLPTLVIIIDDSGSMGLVDALQNSPAQAVWERRLKAAGFDQPTRLAIAQTILLEQQGKQWHDLTHRYRPEIYLLSETLRPLAFVDATDKSSAAHQARRNENENDTESTSVESATQTATNTFNALRAATAQGKASHLGTGVQQLLEDRRGNPPSAIVLVTDGVTTAGPTLSKAGQAARRAGVPLWILGIGSSLEERDLQLGEITAEEYAFVGDAVALESSLLAVGLESQSLELTLREANSTEPLVRQTHTLPRGAERERIRLSWRPPRIGDYELTLEAPILPGETRTDNNQRTHLLRVRDQRLRVLLIAGQPSFDYRFLKELWLREKSIEVRSHLQSADADFIETNKEGELITLARLPESAQEFNKYDALVMIDPDLELLTRATRAALAQYVIELGGNMIFLAGQNYWPSAWSQSPLGELLPIDPSLSAWHVVADPAAPNFHVQPTELGLNKPFFQLGVSPAETLAIWQSLDRWTTWLECRQTRPATQILAVHPTARGPNGQPWPLVIFRLTGAGKVLMHAGDETWRWQARGGQKMYARYWTQALRYLCRAKLVARDQPARLLTDREEYQSGETVQIAVRFADESLTAGLQELTLELDLPDGASRRISLHAAMADRANFSTFLPRLSAGNYHARVRDPSRGLNLQTTWKIRPPAVEGERTRLNAEELQRAAAESKGRYYTLTDVDRLWRELPPGRPLPVESLPPFPLWNQWPVLAVVLGLFLLEWWLRKRWGMV